MEIYQFCALSFVLVLVLLLDCWADEDDDDEDDDEDEDEDDGQVRHHHQAQNTLRQVILFLPIALTNSLIIRLFAKSQLTSVAKTETEPQFPPFPPVHFARPVFRVEKTVNGYQGRYKGELIEDESYFWTVSRYIHRNPVRGKRPLVKHPRDCAWSSYRGYADKRNRLSWIAYHAVLDAWQGGMGGNDPAPAYRRFVQQGVEAPPEDPFEKAAHGWLLGSQAFVERIRKEMKSPRFADEVPRVRTLEAVDFESVFAAVSNYYQVAPSIFAERGHGHIARAAAAWLCRRLTTATLRELSLPLGLSRPESVSNLTRRRDKHLSRDLKMRRELAKIESRLAHKTKTRPDP